MNYKGEIMKNVKTIEIFFILGFFVLSGCAGNLAQDGNSLKMISSVQIIKQSLYVKGKEYNSVVKYDKRIGEIRLYLSDLSDKPAKIITSKYVNALLIKSDVESEIINLKNPATRFSSSGSHRSRSHPRFKPKSDVIYAQKVFMKNLSSFSLRVWLPIDGTTYQIDYHFS